MPHGNNINTTTHMFAHLMPPLRVHLHTNRIRGDIVREGSGGQYNEKHWEGCDQYGHEKISKRVFTGLRALSSKQVALTWSGGGSGWSSQKKSI
jgi:hypothetical protein